MAKVSKETIEHLARLARIAISSQEAERMQGELDAILGYVEKLSQVDTKQLKTTSQVTGLTDVWRKDEVKKSSLSCEQLLGNAPATKDGYIKVKKVL